MGHVCAATLQYRADASGEAHVWPTAITCPPPLRLTALPSYPSCTEFTPFPFRLPAPNAFGAEFWILSPVFSPRPRPTPRPTPSPSMIHRIPMHRIRMYYQKIYSPFHAVAAPPGVSPESFSGRIGPDCQPPSSLWIVLSITSPAICPACGELARPEPVERVPACDRLPRLYAASRAHQPLPAKPTLTRRRRRLAYSHDAPPRPTPRPDPSSTMMHRIPMHRIRMCY
jgi:hypothetical protein